MGDWIKKYWAQILVVGSLLGTGIVYIAGMDSRMYDSAEQKVEHDNHVKNALTPVQQAEAKLSDSLNNAHASEIRQLRYEDNKRADSIKLIYDRKKDSITLDYIKRQTVQIEKMNTKIDNINN